VPILSHYNFLQLSHNFCSKPNGAGRHEMESKLYEECHEGGGFMAQQAMLKQDETVRTQIPTMKPLE